MKYFQKSIDKYTQLLVSCMNFTYATSICPFQDEKDISEHVQIDGQLFHNLLTKTEQRLYFQSIEAPLKPLQ